MNVEVWSDGSGNSFGSDGGCGWRILVDGEIKHEGSCYLSNSTNNVAECTAAIKGLEWVEAQKKCGSLPQDVKVTLFCDSQLVLGYASGKYQCKALHLTQLYIQLRKLYSELSCTQQWIKGHSGNENNEACDKLAKVARESKGITP